MIVTKKEVHEVFADPKHGIAFHKVFGRDAGEMVLISLLNAILDLSGEQAITHLTRVPGSKAPQIPPFYQAHYFELYLTVKATTYAGVTFIVNMQVKTQSYYGIRTAEICKSAKSHLFQTQKRPLNTKPGQVICIIIVDFSVFSGAEYLSTYTRVKNPPRFEDLVFIWIELPNFHKAVSEARTVLEQWLYFFKYADTLQDIPQSFLSTYELVDAFERIKFQNWIEEDIDVYKFFP